MASNSHLEILCAEAQRFPQPPAEAATELEELRAAAAELASTLTFLPDQRSSRFFAQHWKSLKTALQALRTELEAQGQGAVSDEFRWLQENTRLLNNALQDTAELARLKKPPQVRTARGATVPRVVAVAVSPYSTLLALPVDTGASVRNLHRISKEGWMGSYGFYEAADYTAAPPSSRRHSYELVRCWMAHHQGMSLLAIANLFHDCVLQRWFHNNPRVQATELLLQEKPVAGIRLGGAQRGTAAA
jgi:hypothetical protein